MHVSTCYVGGLRKGVAPEARLTHEVDWRAEYAAAKAARDRVEIAVARVRPAAQLHGCRAAPSTARRARRRSRRRARRPASSGSRAELVDAGRTRAQSLGWTDVYTLTKAFAERAAEELWGENGHRLSIVRRPIIESALQHPFPGWIDGFKVADPLIIAYGRGLLPEFPGLPDSILDVIPVDFVVNAILAAAANPAAKNEPEYYHVASGASNPLPFHQDVRERQPATSSSTRCTDKKGEDHRGADLEVPGRRQGRERRARARSGSRCAAEKLLGRLPDTERRRGAGTTR